MANLASPSVIPRFLLPQMTWGATAVRRAGPGTIAASRHLSISGTNHVRPQRPTHHSAPLRHRIPQPSIRKRSYNPNPITTELAARRQFSATTRNPRDHHFDTLKFVQRLKDEGFTEEQAEAMMRVLSDVIEERYAVRVLSYELPSPPPS